MICQKCNQQFSDNYPFCPYCGEKSVRDNTCSKCGKQYSYEYSFCPYCSAPSGSADTEKKPKGTAFNKSSIIAIIVIVVLSIALIVTLVYRFTDLPVADENELEFISYTECYIPEDPEDISLIVDYRGTTVAILGPGDWEYVDELAIPEKINGYPVTVICNNAFRECEIMSVTIPEGVTTIGDSAFFNCDSLKSVTIPKSVTQIRLCAFYDCGKISDVYYAGTKEEWSVIGIEDGNYCLENAKIHFES